MIARKTWLRLEANQTTLRTPPYAGVALAVGVHALATSIFRHDPPTPAELEQVIDAVEDALMAARLPRGDGGEINSTDSILRELPGLQAPGAQLSRDAIEALFQQLASASSGHSGTVSLPQGGPAKAALIILRECMHHLDYDSILMGDAHPLAQTGP